MAGILFRTDYVVDGNAKGAVNANNQARSSMRGLRSEQQQALRTNRRYTKSVDDSISGLRGWGSNLSNVSRLFAGLTAGIGAFQAIRLTDAFDDLNARLRVVTKSTLEYERAQEAVFDIAQETFTGLRSTADLYGRLARSLDGLNVSQERTLELSRTINQAFQVSGSTTQEAAAAAIQLAQGLAAGALRGDEFRSVSEQGIRVLQALREGLQVTQGELRKMANAGELTAKKVLAALESQAATINEEFGELPLTMARAIQLLGNAITRFLGETNQSVPIVRLLARAVKFTADNINLLANATVLLAIAWKTRLLSVMSEVIVAAATVRNRQVALLVTEGLLTKSNFTLAGSFTVLSTAIAATGRVLSVLTILAGRLLLIFGPVGIAIGTIVGAVSAFRDMNREISGAEEGSRDLLKTLRDINKEVDEFTEKEIDKEFAAGLDKINELLQEQLEIREQLATRQAFRSTFGGGGILGARAETFEAGFEEQVDPRVREELERRQKIIDELTVSLAELSIRSGRAQQAVNEAFTDIASSLDNVNDRIPPFVSALSQLPMLGRFAQDLANRIRDISEAAQEPGLGKFSDQIEGIIAKLDPNAKAVFDFRKEVRELQKTFEAGGRKDLKNFNLGLQLLSKLLRQELQQEMDKSARATERATNALERLQQLAVGFQGDLSPISAEVAFLIKEQNRLFDLLQKAGPQGVQAYNEAMIALNKTYQKGAMRVLTYSDDVERLFEVLKPTAADIAETEQLILILSERFGDQHVIVLQLLAVLERLTTVYLGAGRGAESFAERLGLFGGRGEEAVDTFAELLGKAFDDAADSRSFKNFFKDIVAGFRAAADQGGKELAQALADASNFAALTVDAFRSNPDAPLRAITEVASQIPGIVGAIAQTVAAWDSIFGGRILGTNFEVSGSGRNLAFGPGGFGGSTFIEEERQRSFFRGTSRRTTESALDPQTLAQLDDFFDQVAEAMQASARELGVNVPMLIAGEFAETFDEDGNLVSSISTILGRTFQEGFEQFTQRVLAENILAVVSQAVGDVEVTQALTRGGFGIGREDFAGGFGGNLDQVIGETTVLQNEAQAIAERWRDDAELLLEGAQFLLLAQSRIQEGFGLLLDEGGLTATADLVEDLSFAGESLSETFLRLVDSVSITEDVIELFEGAFTGTREEMVRFSDDLAQAAGGIERLRGLFESVLGFFFSPEEALGFRIQGAQRRRDTLLTDLGIDPNIAADEFQQILADALNEAADPETIAALLEAGAAIADLAVLEQQLADIRQEAIDAQIEAAQDAAETLADIMRDVDRQIAESTLTDFQFAVRDLVIDFHDMTDAAIAAGAGVQELAQIQIATALQFQQLTEQLRFDTIDLAAQLFGTPLEEIERRISELQGRQSGQRVNNTLDQIFKRWESGLKRIREFVDDLFLDETLSPLNPRQRLNEAERQFFETLTAAQSGDIDALSRLTDVSQAFLSEAESFFPRAGSDFRQIFDLVTSLLSGLGIPAGVGQGQQQPGLFTPGDMTLLADLLAQRDAIRAEQQATEDARLLSQLFDNIRDLAGIGNQSLTDIFSDLGIDPFDLADRLGIDLNDMSAFTDAQLRDLANDLGVEFGDLGDIFDQVFGDLTDPNSRVNNALENTIDALPPDIRAQLLPLLANVESAVTTADARQAIEDLETAVGMLPLDLQLLLAPFLPNIDAASPVQQQLGELQTLNVTQNLALANLQSIAGILGASVVRGFGGHPLPPLDPDPTGDAAKKTDTLLSINRGVLVELQKLTREGLPTDTALGQEFTLNRVAVAVEKISKPPADEFVPPFQLSK